MSTFTRRQLVDQIGFKLGALSAGQVLAAEDVQAIDGILASLFDQLAEDEILTIGDDNSIPASWCPFLATLGANLAAPDYGGSFDVNAKQGAEAILRKLVRGKETFERQTPEYF